MGLRKFFSAADTKVKQISEIFGVVGVVALTFMMLLTVCDVCLRYFFNRPIMASAEFTEYLMLVTGFLGMGWCAVKNTHIKVELIVGRFPDKAQGIVDTINAIIILGLSAFIALQSFSEGMTARAMGKASSITDIPHYPFYMIVVLGYILLFFAMLPILVQSIKKASKR
jgi:TRAP-type C4-dicarboxylate transport system permease small subunit